MRSAMLMVGAVSAAQLAQCAPPSVIQAVTAAKTGARAALFEVVTQRDQGFVTADGVRLAADVYLPKEPAPRKRPTVLVRAPLSRVPLHEAFADLLGGYFAARGYAVVVQGTRGRWRSGGAYYPLVSDRQDGIQTLAWLARQPWYDGRVGTFGGSAFGYTQWAIADQRDPGPTAMLVQIASTDHHGFFWPGGAFSLQSALYWARTSRGAIDVFPTQDELTPGLHGFPAIEADVRSGGRVGVFRDWASRPAVDAYWKQIDGERRPERAEAPALLLAGWYDPYLPGQLADYARIKAGAKLKVAGETRLVIGPWTHARQVILPGGVDPGDYRFESLAPALPWFDRQLPPPEVTTPAPAGPPVRLFVMGENRWRDEAAWPLARAVPTAYWLRSRGHAVGRDGDGRLDLARPYSPEEPDRFVHDPRDPVASTGGAMLGALGGAAAQTEVDTRPDVLVYQTPPLAEATEVTGPVKLELEVGTDAPATDFMAVLCDVHPDGTAYNLSEGAIRRGYAGQPTIVTIDMWPTSNVFLPGHRIRLQVSSSYHPRFDVHPNVAGPTWLARTPRIAHQTLFHGVNHLSRLTLPIVPRP